MNNGSPNADENRTMRRYRVAGAMTSSGVRKFRMIHSAQGIPISRIPATIINVMIRQCPARRRDSEKSFSPQVREMIDTVAMDRPWMGALDQNIISDAMAFAARNVALWSRPTMIVSTRKTIESIKLSKTAGAATEAIVRFSVRGRRFNRWCPASIGSGCFSALAIDGAFYEKKGCEKTVFSGFCVLIGIKNDIGAFFV